jgi:hypothetical protein
LEYCYLQPTVGGPSVHSFRSLGFEEVHTDVAESRLALQINEISYQTTQPWNVNIQPNPGSDSFILHSSGQDSDCQISLRNELGQVLMEQELKQHDLELNLDLSNFNSGVYYLEIRPILQASKVIKVILLRP